MNPIGNGHADGPNGRDKLRLVVLVMAGLPKHGTRGINTTLNLLLAMKKDALQDTTIEGTGKRLDLIAKNTDINNPDAVKNFIANKQCSSSYKATFVTAYNHYAKYNNLQWNPPKYRTQAHNVKIPTKEKIDQLIAYSGRKMQAKLLISVECGLRPIEVCNLKVKDIDLDKRELNPTTAKHGAPRTLKIPIRLESVLREHINREHLNQNDRLFPITPRNYSKMFRESRNHLANKIHDPTIKNIRLYDLRHYYATMLYHKTRDIILVKTLLGHRDIKNTMIYTQLLNFEEEEYNVKTATNIKEATELLEAGFTYITDMEGLKLFRKRK